MAHDQGRRAGHPRLVHWFNTDQIHSYLDDTSPDEFEVACAAAQTGQPLVGIELSEPARDLGRIRIPTWIALRVAFLAITAKSPYTLETQVLIRRGFGRSRFGTSTTPCNREQHVEHHGEHDQNRAADEEE